MNKYPLGRLIATAVVAMLLIVAGIALLRLQNWVGCIASFIAALALAIGLIIDVRKGKTR